MEKIKIYSSKKKSLLLFLGSGAFVLLGVWLFLESHSTFFVQGVGLANIIFFGVGFIVAAKRLVVSQIALTLDPRGLFINSRALSGQPIAWSDIERFDEVILHHGPIIAIGIYQPDSWIRKQKNIFWRALFWLSLYYYNSPFTISASALTTEHLVLLRTLREYHEKYYLIQKRCEERPGLGPGRFVCATSTQRG